MSSYAYTATGSAAESANIATDKIRIATSTSAIHYETGYPKTNGTGNITCATNSPTVTGTATSFIAELDIGYWIGNATGTTVGIIQSIANAESITLTANAGVAVSDAEFTYNPYGVPYPVATANSTIIPANNIERSIYVGQGNVVSFLNVSGTAGPFTVTELGMPHADTGTSGFTLK